jgi:hypothetical protein
MNLNGLGTLVIVVVDSFTSFFSKSIAYPTSLALLLVSKRIEIQSSILYFIAASSSDNTSSITRLFLTNSCSFA